MLGAPAHLASLNEARPRVIHLLGLAREAGVDLPAAVSPYDSGIVRAKEGCSTGLTFATAPFIFMICNRAAEAATKRFDLILYGYRPHPAGGPVATGRVGDPLIS